MARRRSLSRALALCHALALASLVLAPSNDAWAQAAGLRASPDDFNGFPTSPSTAPITSPENVSPATVATPSPEPADDGPTRATTTTDQDATGPNYGKPRKKKPKLFTPNAKTSPPLPALVPYRGAPGTLLRGLPVATPAVRAAGSIPAATTTIVDAPQPAPTVAVIPTLPRPRRVPDELDPFAPTGLRIGQMRLLPFVETSAGYETNPNQLSTQVKPSAVLRVDGGLDAVSDFSSGSLTANIRGGYSDFPSNSNANRPDANGNVVGRIDVTRDDRIDLETRLSVSTQTPGSPQLAVPNSVFTISRPTIISEGATLGGTHVFNRLSLGLRATFDRTQYGDATQSDGTIARYSQDNFNDYGVVGRAAYELTPALIPFAEVGYDSRVRDNTLDLSGYARSSNGVLGRAGSSFEFSRIFTGSISAGYADRKYADPRLPNLRGPTVDGSLVYAFSPITTLTFRANTTLSETTLPGASGAISRQISVELAHIFFRNFTVSGIVTYQPNEYQGVSVQETFTSIQLKAAYSVSREVQLTASATRQALSSSLLGSSFTDTIFLAGVRLQR